MSLAVVLKAYVSAGDLLFNPLNFQAAKGNQLQSALDYAWQTRALSDIVLQIPVNGKTAQVSFDRSRVYFFGHSQGANAGALLATSPALQALALSAPAGHIPTQVLGKSMPVDTINASSMMKSLICDDPKELLDVHHPVLNLYQQWFEAVDAANYAPLLIRETPLPKHVFVISGTEDHYVVPASQDAVVTAARLKQVSPSLRVTPTESLLSDVDPSGGFESAYSSLSGNVSVGADHYTGAFRQYHSTACDDDHFLFSCLPLAIADWTRFFTTVSRGEIPVVGP